MSVDIKYVPLTFIKSDDEILRQIKNTVYFSFLFGQFEETTLSHYLESTQYGYTASASPVGTHQLLRITDINNGTVDWQNVPFCNCDSELKYLLKDEDILIARTGGTTGKSFIVNDVPNNAIFASYLIRLRLKKGVDIQFINCFLNSYTFWSQIIEMKSGSAMPNVNAEKLKTLKLPKCDLKTQQAVAAFTKNELNEIDNFHLLQKIAFVESIFNTGNNISIELNNQLDLVKQLRQSFLREAMQGKLLGTHEGKEENQETGQQLLERIKAEKAQLIKDKKLKKEKELPPIKPEEISFEIPENWVWCRLGEIFKFIDYRGKTPTRIEQGVRLISAKNIKFGYIDNNPIEYISESEYDKWMVRGFPKNGDLLFVTEGHTMGFVASINLDFKYVLAQRTICLQPPIYDYVNFVFYSLMSPLIQKEIKKIATGSSAMGVQSAKLKGLLLPFPSIYEQRLIVQKIERLMLLCDNMEASIKQSRQQNEQLLQQVLREALEVKEVVV